MTTEDAPLVVGSAYGIRAFRTTPDFPTRDRANAKQLYPLTSLATNPWKPGWNDAMCPYRCGQMKRDKVMEMWLHSGWTWMPFPAGPDSPASVALDCSCGFHAYTDANRLSQQVTPHDNNRSIVMGIVEGAGTTVEATHGFRSKRARVVALVRPPWSHFWSFQAALVLFFLVLCVWLSTSLAIEGWTWGTGIACVMDGAAAGANFAGLRQATRTRRHVKRISHAFGVPTFPSRQAAMEAFPLGLGGPDRKRTSS